MRGCWRGWMRAWPPAAMGPARRSGSGLRWRRRSSAPCPPRLSPRRRRLSRSPPRALVRLDGAYYSVPCRWAGLDLVARTGAATVTIIGPDGTAIPHPRKRFGQRSIDYRHYLPELAKKPQAVRQVLPDLLRDLGDPFPAVWTHFHAAHPEREAARLFAKVLGQ